MIPAIVIFALLGNSPFVVPPPSRVNGDTLYSSGEAACFAGDGTQSSVVGFGDEWCEDEYGVRSGTLCAAETPQGYYILGQNASPLTATAGGDLYMHGGLGRRAITGITAASLGGDTVILTVGLTGAAAATCTCTEDGTSASTKFDCTGETNAVCATNIAACINAAPNCAGVEACAGTGCTAFTAATDALYIYRSTALEAPARSIVLSGTADGSGATYASGTDGIMVVGGATTLTAAIGIGGNTSVFPGLARNGAQLRVIQADNSAQATFAGASVLAQASAGYVALDVANGVFGQWDGAAYKSVWLNTTGEIATGTGLNQSTSWGTIKKKCWVATGIDTSSAAKLTIMTTPTGKTFYPMEIMVSDPSAAISAWRPSFGCDAGATNFMADAGVQTIASGSGLVLLSSETASSPTQSTECATTEIFGVDTVAQEGAADTVTIEVCGILR